MEIADCYRLLGLRMGASYEDVKTAYRRLARLYHPDANPTDQLRAKEKFIQVTEAYRRLTSVIQPSTSTRRSSSSPAPSQSAPSQPAPSASQTTATNPPRRSPANPTTPAAPSVKASPSEPPPKPPIRVTNLTPIDQELKQESYVQLQQLLREHRFPRAITLIEGLAHRLPRDAEVRQWQAITYQRFGRYLISIKQPEKAKRYLQKALRIDPHNRSLAQEIDRDLRRIDQVEVR